MSPRVIMHHRAYHFAIKHRAKVFHQGNDVTSIGNVSPLSHATWPITFKGTEFITLRSRHKPIEDQSTDSER